MLYIRLCSNRVPFLFILYNQKSLPSTYNTPLHHNSSIFAKFVYTTPGNYFASGFLYEQDGAVEFWEPLV